MKYVRVSEPALRELTAEGYSQREMATIFGVSPTSIRVKQGECGIEPPWGKKKCDSETMLGEL